MSNTQQHIAQRATEKNSRSLFSLSYLDVNSELYTIQCTQYMGYITRIAIRFIFDSLHSVVQND